MKRSIIVLLAVVLLAGPILPAQADYPPKPWEYWLSADGSLIYVRDPELNNGPVLEVDLLDKPENLKWQIQYGPPPKGSILLAHTDPRLRYVTNAIAWAGENRRIIFCSNEVTWCNFDDTGEQWCVTLPRGTTRVSSVEVYSYTTGRWKTLYNAPPRRWWEPFWVVHTAPWPPNSNWKAVAFCDDRCLRYWVAARIRNGYSLVADNSKTKTGCSCRIGG